MRDTDVFVDHYQVLSVEMTASATEIRRAFRARLLEVHPDKAARPTDAAGLQRVIRAFEVLGDPDAREHYDRVLERHRQLDPSTSKIPHITESERPAGRARAILYFLLNERGDEALTRLREIEEDPVDFLARHFEHGEFVDSAFLLAELFEERKAYADALRWFQEIIRLEKGRRNRRPCYPEVVDRTKRLLMHKLQPGLDPRVSLEYLRRAEALGLTRPERAELLKRRAQCYLDVDMKHEAARLLLEALEVQPNLKGVRKLKEALADYLPE